jgi:hypothetical protein
MTYEALNKTLERAVTVSLTCTQFAFSLFSGSLATEDLLASGNSINW